MTSNFSKNMKQENFPVARLVNKKLAPIVESYYTAARLADDIADAMQIPQAEKALQLAQIEKDFWQGYNLCSFDGGVRDVYSLGRIFAKQNLDASLYVDLIRAFEKDINNQEIFIWEDLIAYSRLSASPVGRFILALYNENSSTYIPAETLCAVLQISNHLQDLRCDAINLNRCYLPKNLMEKYDVRFSDIFLNKSTPGLKSLLAEITNKLRQMINDSSILPCLLKSKRLKIQIGIILSLTNSMLEKIDNQDVLIKHIKLSCWDWAKALIFGALKGLMRKN